MVDVWFQNKNLDIKIALWILFTYNACGQGVNAYFKMFQAKVTSFISP